MWSLRSKRDGECHYIRNKGKYVDSEKLIQYKLYLMKNKLIEYKRSGDKTIKYIDKLIEIVDKKITIEKFNLSDFDEEENEWWIE